MRAKKSLGQNFLMHQATAERIAEASGVTKQDTVLEIGPGTGMLTEPLLARAGKVIAVEADEELVEQMRTLFARDIAAGRLQLIHGDIRAFDPASIGKPYVLVANIPYYLTGEIIRSFLSSPHRPTSMTLLVQKEVAERIAREKKESLLSLAVKAYGTPRYRFTVPAGAFIPKPKVDSAVLSITDIKNPFASKEEERRFFEVLRAGFAHKRKLLAGNLSGLVAPDALQQADIAPAARAENVPLDAWMALARP